MIRFTNEDLQPQTIPVEIGGKNYVLREATEAVAKKYQDAASGSVKMRDGKIVGIQGLGRLQTLLLSLCLSEIGDTKADGSPVLMPVKEAVIDSWPAKVVRRLFDECKKISGLDEKPTQKELERQYAELCEQLFSVASNEQEKQDWLEWMNETMRRAAGLEDDLGPVTQEQQRDGLKN